MNYVSLFSCILLLAIVLLRFNIPLPLPLSLALLAISGLAWMTFKQSKHIFLFPLLFISILVMAVYIPIPLPLSWSPLFRLGIIVSWWGVVYSILAGIIIKKSFK